MKIAVAGVLGGSKYPLNLQKSTDLKSQDFLRIFARGQGVSPCKNFFAEIFFDRKKLSDKEYSCLYIFLHKNYSTIIFNFNEFFCYNLQNEKKVKGKKSV